MPTRSNDKPVLKARSSKASMKKEDLPDTASIETPVLKVRSKTKTPITDNEPEKKHVETVSESVGKVLEPADVHSMAETGGQVIPATEYIETPVKEMKKFKESRFTSEPDPRVPTKYDRMNDALDTKPASFSVPRPVVSVEPPRYSARRKAARHDNSTIGKVILFLVIVIVAGVGLSLLLRDVLFKPSNSESNTTSSVSAFTSTAYLPSILLLDKDEKADSLSTSITPNSDYTQTALNIGSSQNTVAGAIVTGVGITRYTSFVRVLITIAGAETGLPPTSVSYNETSREITLVIDPMTISDTGMLDTFDIEVGSIVAITTSLDESNRLSFVFTLSEDSKYFVQANNGELLMDIKTMEDLNTQPTVSTSSTISASSSVSSSASSSVAADGVNYDNDPSQKKQYVVSNVEGRKLYNENYYYEDRGPDFQFSWALRGSGEESIPNAEAEIVNIDGTNYIQLTIHNLFVDLLYATGKTEPNIKISLLGSPVAKIELKSYNIDTATSVYLVQLRYKADFRLHATETEGDFRLLSLQVYD